jgi:hypothetical protein
MTTTQVSSSMIQSIDYDEATQTMTVTFANGTRHSYDGVSQDKHDALVGADSVGRHFLDNIRDQHESRKV